MQKIAIALILIVLGLIDNFLVFKKKKGKNILFSF